jgi:hypothetical protein
MGWNTGWRNRLAILVGLAWLSGAPAAQAQQEPAVIKGLQFLRSRAGQVQVGESALMALAMIKADLPANDTGLTACMAKVRARFAGSSYTPERGGGADIYEAAVVAMALVNLDAVANRSYIESAAQYLIGRQNPNGSWDYKGRTQGDSSISQYALLGLWECENAGINVPPNVWDTAAGWYMSVQSGAGSWNYHRDEGAQYPETLSMTAAGVGSLLLCDRQLSRYRKPTDTPNPLLVPIQVEGQPGQQRFDVAHSAAAINDAAKRGIAWLGRNFVLNQAAVVGKTPYYALYGMERIGALADRETLGGVDWFTQGLRFVTSTQKANGAWNSDYGEEVNTSYAILFITRATKKSIRKFEIKRLGGGNLLGGKGLPKDLTSFTVAQGRVVVRPMNGAVEGMLKVLEDPRAENADSALSGLVERYQAQGPDGLRPFKDRFRKLLMDADPGVRRVAAWALGRTADLDVVPLLVATLRHPQEDENVVDEARTSLQFLSRKIDGFGPPIPSTPQERVEAARKWLAWYNSTRPIDQNPADDLLLGLEPTAAPTGQPAAAGGQAPANSGQPPGAGGQPLAPGAQPPVTSGRTP